LKFELFSDIFTFRDNALRRLDPRVKVIVALVAIFAVVSSQGVLFPALVFSLASMGMLLVGLPAAFMLGRFLAPLGSILILFLLHAVLYGWTPLFSLQLFGQRVVIMQEGVLRGMHLACRVLGGFGVMVLLSSVTPSHQIFHALAYFGVPKGWLEVAMMMYRYIFVMLESAADAMAAQRVRLGYSGLERSLKSLGVLSGVVIVNSLEQAQRTHEAMLARGYKGHTPFGPMPALSPKDGWILGLSLGALIGLYLVTEEWIL